MYLTELVGDSSEPRRRLTALLAGICLWLMHSCLSANEVPAADAFALPEPLSLEQVMQAARHGRAEIAAARARAAAARERGAIVSALEDPMLMPAIDHYPYQPMKRTGVMDSADAMNAEEKPQADRRYDWSITLEQRFPLSRVRGHQQRGAVAQARSLTADSERVALDIELQAAEAFLMLHETRRMLAVLNQQVALAKQLLDAAAARSATTRGAQLDVLRAEVDIARLQGRYQAQLADERGMQAMLNASIGRAVEARVPQLASPPLNALPPTGTVLIEQALARRPELQSGRAEVERALAEVEVMRSMYKPMGMVRLGTASTMAEGSGAMVMIGISLPIWRDKLRAGVAEARAMESMARADLLAMQQMIGAETISAREKVVAAREAYLALRDHVLPRARMAVEPALAGFSAGTGALANVLEALQTQWSLEAELVMAETNLALAWVKLDRARGQLQAPQVIDTHQPLQEQQP